MCCKKYTCDQCKEACTLAESKPKGSNPDIRIEKICKGNRRNMEKRVKRRPETRDDPLRKLWSAIIADKDKLAAWSRKMKTRKHYEHNEITMEVIEEEVKRFIMEQRIQKEYYCFATLQEENENLSEEEQIKLWKKRVERSKDKLEKNGILYIAKAPKLLVSEIEQNEANQSIRRSQETPDAATLEKAHEQGLANLAKSQAHMQQEHGHQDNLEIPAEAEDVDHVLHNRGGAVGRALKSSAMLAQCGREMRAVQQRMAEEDREDAADFIAKAEATPVDTPPKDKSRKKVNDFEVAIVERKAKLEASHVSLVQEWSLQMEGCYDHLEGEAKKQVEAEVQGKADAVVRAIKEYKEAVNEFISEHGDSSKVVNLTMSEDEIDAAVAKSDAWYKRFFSKEGVMKDFRAAIKIYKKEIADLEKERQKRKRAASCGKGAKRKQVEVDDEEEMPIAVKAIYDVLEKKSFENVGVTDSAANYPQSPLYNDKLTDDDKHNLNSLKGLAQYGVMKKWANTQLKRQGGTEVTVEVLNKKLLNDLTKTFGKLDSKIAQGTFSLVDADTEDLVDTLKNFQCTMTTEEHYSLNILPFGLAEVRVQIDGDCHMLGWNYDKAPGSSIQEKLNQLLAKTAEQLMTIAKQIGFYVHVTEQTVVAVPAGFIVLVVSSAGGSSIRWSTFAESERAIGVPERAIVRRVLASMLDCHSFLAATDYKKLYDVICK